MQQLSGNCFTGIYNKSFYSLLSTKLDNEDSETPSKASKEYFKIITTQ